MDGYNISVISMFTFVLVSTGFFRYSGLLLGLTSGSVFLGAIIGAVLFGHYADRLGRRLIYILYPLFFVAFGALSALATSITQLIVFRFFLGWGAGADYALSPVYASEIYPARERGKGYGWIFAFWNLGALSSFIVGYVSYLCCPAKSWRIAVGAGAVLAVALIFLRRRAPESPRWSIVEGRSGHEEASRILYNAGLSDDEVRGILEERKRQEGITAGSLSELFKGEWGKRTAVAWAQWILYDIGDYGVGLYVPLVVALLGMTGGVTLLASATWYAIGFLGAYGAAQLNDKLGRRKLQLMGFVGMALATVLLTLALGLSLMPLGLLALALWYGLGNLGPGNTSGLYAIELFPTKLRSTSMGSATAITRFVSFLSAFEFPYITLILGKLAFFEVLFVVMLFAAAFTFFFTPETKGLSLEQIATYRYRIVGGRPKLVPPE